MGSKEKSRRWSKKLQLTTSRKLSYKRGDDDCQVREKEKSLIVPKLFDQRKRWKKKKDTEFDLNVSDRQIRKQENLPRVTAGHSLIDIIEKKSFMFPKGNGGGPLVSKKSLVWKALWALGEIYGLWGEAGGGST